MKKIGNFSKIISSDKRSDYFFVFFLNNLGYKITNVFWVVLFLKTRTKWREKHLGQCFVLTALCRLPRHASVFAFSFLCVNFFYMTVFDRGIIRKRVLTWKNNNDDDSCVFCSIAVFNGCYLKYKIKLFAISQLLNLRPWCRIRAAKCVQRTMALYRYKLFDLFPLVVFKRWTQCVIENWDSFFFLRLTQPPFGL